MSWQTWEHDTSAKAQSELAEMILALMGEAAHDTEDPYENLDEWLDAGIEVVGSPTGVENVLVFHEMQETDDGGEEPGYTLAIQLEDGQQDTETFFADDPERWEGIATYFARRIACP